MATPEVAKFTTSSKNIDLPPPLVVLVQRMLEFSRLFRTNLILQLQQLCLAYALSSETNAFILRPVIALGSLFLQCFFVGPQPVAVADDDDDEYDDEMDDFIDDTPYDDVRDVSRHIRDIFGYDRRR